MRNVEPAESDIRQAFPDWTVYRATNQLRCARLTEAQQPVTIVTGEDLRDLADEIICEEAKGGNSNG
jgi:hypothetical protein